MSALLPLTNADAFRQLDVAARSLARAYPDAPAVALLRETLVVIAKQHPELCRPSSAPIPIPVVPDHPGNPRTRSALG